MGKSGKSGTQSNVPSKTSTGHAVTECLKGAGFTSKGVASGSIASGIQSGIGNVAAGSTFATLQSMGSKK